MPQNQTNPIGKYLTQKKTLLCLCIVGDKNVAVFKKG